MQNDYITHSSRGKLHWLASLAPDRKLGNPAFPALSKR